MTKAAYARHKGVSRQTVYDWIARGQLVLAGSKIDVNASMQKTNVGIHSHGT
jgi:transposase